MKVRKSIMRVIVPLLLAGASIGVGTQVASASYEDSLLCPANGQPSVNDVEQDARLLCTWAFNENDQSLSLAMRANSGAIFRVVFVNPEGVGNFALIQATNLGNGGVVRFLEREQILQTLRDGGVNVGRNDRISVVELLDTGHVDPEDVAVFGPGFRIDHFEGDPADAFRD